MCQWGNTGRERRTCKVPADIKLRRAYRYVTSERHRRRKDRQGSGTDRAIPRLLYIYYRASVCHTSIHWVALNATWCGSVATAHKGRTRRCMRGAPTRPTRAPIGHRGKGGKHRSTDPDWIPSHPAMLTRAHGAILTGELIFLRVS